MLLNIRRGVDGSFWIPRRHKETEDYLDANYIRLKNELKWVGKIPNTANLFKNIYEHQTGYIIGKGPSLDDIKTEYFETEGPVFCINESIHAIEILDINNPIYGTQLDSELKETCKPSKATTKLFVGPRCGNLYDKETYKIIIDPQTFGLYSGCISAEFAIAIARLMGVSNLVFMGFDGCVDGDFDYAPSIGYSSIKFGNNIRFASHRKIILDATKMMPITWINARGQKVEALI